MTVARRIFLSLAVLLTSALSTRAAGIVTNASADLVLGQALFTTNASATPATSGSLRTPAGVAVDPTTGKIFVADSGNNRVLRYASGTALANGANPEAVIGQSTFSASSANQGSGVFPSVTSLSLPNDVCVDSTGRLWIADTGNSRVLLFENAANLSNNPNADRVFGQPDFTSYLSNHTQSTLGNPRGVCVDPAGTLWVADTGSHRVLGWKLAATLANGANADRVLGQPDFTDNTARTTQRGMFNPWGVSASGTSLWVADHDNNRVLLFGNYPSINYAPASIVLGQTTYTASTAGTSATALTFPTSVAISGADLWVCDDGNNRVLFFPSFASLAPGGAATIVVGQATLTTGSSGTTAQKLALLESHITVDAAGSLFVADRLNNRALRFSASTTPVTPPVPPVVPASITLTGAKKVTVTKSSVTIRGTAAASSGIRRVSYNLNDQGYLRAKGTTSWKAKINLPYGRSKIVVNSVANDGTVSPPLKVTVTRE